MYRYVHEAFEVLAAPAPALPDAARTARTKAFVILDGTLLSTDRIAADQADATLRRWRLLRRRRCTTTRITDIVKAVLVLQLAASR